MSVPEKLEPMKDYPEWLNTSGFVGIGINCHLKEWADEILKRYNAYPEMQTEIEQLKSSIIEYVNNENKRQVAFSQVIKFVEVIKKYHIDIDKADKDDAYEALTSALLCDYRKQIADQQALIEELVKGLEFAECDGNVLKRTRESVAIALAKYRTTEKLKGQ